VSGRPRAAVSWSGGKDSCAAFERSLAIRERVLGPDHLEVADVLRKTLALITKEAEEHGRVEIAAEFADRMPPVRADAEQLLQVFLNLSLNAVQAMPHGGKLWIATALRRATRRGAAAAFLEVRFRDTGVGIPPGDLKNLFIPFFTTKDKGTGLGLPISQRIIENHGGTIEARSQPGEGATFTVLLPIEADVYAAYLESIRGEPSRETTRRGPPPLPPPAPPPPVPPAGRIPPPRRTPSRCMRCQPRSNTWVRPAMEATARRPVIRGGSSRSLPATLGSVVRR